MRIACLIVGGNVLAFALGAVITAWLLALGLPMLPQPGVATLASLEKPPTPAMAQERDSKQQAPTLATADSAQAGTARPRPAPPADAATPAHGPKAGISLPSVPTAAVTADPVPPPDAPPPAPVPAPPAVFVPVTPAALPTAAITPTTAASAGYALQLGAFEEPTNAARLQAVVSRAGYSAYIVPANSGGRSWQLVRIGGYASREAAAAAAAALQRDTGVAALIMKPPLR